MENYIIPDPNISDGKPYKQSHLDFAKSLDRFYAPKWIMGTDDLKGRYIIRPDWEYVAGLIAELVKQLEADNERMKLHMAGKYPYFLAEAYDRIATKCGWSKYSSRPQSLFVEDKLHQLEVESSNWKELYDMARKEIDLWKSKVDNLI
jgi:hypothetical protein